MKPDIGSGDEGQTDLPGNRRVPKDSPVMEALGALDETQSALGLARALAGNAERRELLRWCQAGLEACAAEVSGGARRGQGFNLAEGARRLEREMRRLSDANVRPTAFVLPGESAPEAALNVARAVVRRAERRAFALARTGAQVDPTVLVYLNRLSDFLFDLACSER